MTAFIEIATTITAMLLTIPLLAFAWIYDRGSVPPAKRKYPWGRGIWRKSLEGQTVMAQKLVITLFLVLILVSRLWGPFSGIEILKFLIYISASVVFTSMLSVLIKALKKGQDKSSKEKKW